MKQLLFRIRTPESMPTLHASEFREKLARALDGEPHCAEFFNYDERGIPLNAPADIRIVGGRHWVGILSKSGSPRLLDQVVGVATRLVSAHYDRPLAAYFEHPELEFKHNYVATPHYFRNVAIKVTPMQRDSYVPTDVVKRALLAQFERDAKNFGIDIPHEDDLGLVILDADAKGMRLCTTRGATNQYVALLNGRFLINGRMNGFWQIGHLQSRGHGRVRPCLESWSKGATRARRADDAMMIVTPGVLR